MNTVGINKDYTQQQLAAELEPNKQAEEYRLNVVTIADFLAQELPQRNTLLSPWLPEQGLAMVYAPRGVGKTFVGLNVACAIASGGEFLGWKAEKPRGVLYLDGEMPGAVMQERLAQIVQASDKELTGRFDLLTPDIQPDHMPDLTLPTYQKLVDQHLEGIDLIVVDNISTLCRSSKENEAEGWIPVQEWALRMRASGRSVLFIHHAGKGGKQRGTSKREDVLDTVISLKRPPDYSPEQGSCFEIHFEKSRTFYGVDADPILASLIVDERNKQQWSVQSLDKSNYNKVIDLFREGLSQKEIAQELDINKSNVSRHIKRAKQEGFI